MRASLYSLVTAVVFVDSCKCRCTFTDSYVWNLTKLCIIYYVTVCHNPECVGCVAGGTSSLNTLLSGRRGENTSKHAERSTHSPRWAVNVVMLLPLYSLCMIHCMSDSTRIILLLRRISPPDPQPPLNK